MGRDGRPRCAARCTSVSIHPPRVGRDHRSASLANAAGVSIHPPRVGRDVTSLSMDLHAMAFQSTLPVWGGTCVLGLPRLIPHVSIHPPRVGRDKPAPKMGRVSTCFNPPSPCGEGPAHHRLPGRFWGFQSTLPVWGGTCSSSSFTSMDSRFQSTLPVWGGTFGCLPVVGFHVVSIHPPRVGRDARSRTAKWGGIGFNPPSPCGEGLSPPFGT